MRVLHMPILSVWDVLAFVLFLLILIIPAGRDVLFYMFPTYMLDWKRRKKQKGKEEEEKTALLFVENFFIRWERKKQRGQHIQHT